MNKIDITTARPRQQQKRSQRFYVCVAVFQVACHYENLMQKPKKKFQQKKKDSKKKLKTK